MPETDSSQVLLEWETLDAIPHERGARWYMTGGILVIAFAAYGIFDGSWTTALLAIMIGGIYFLMRGKKPITVRVQITTMGIKIAGTFLPWNLIKDFWILLGDGHAEVHLAPAKLMQREHVILIQNIDPGVVREHLLAFVPERPGMEERLLDTLARYLKL